MPQPVPRTTDLAPALHHGRTVMLCEGTRLECVEEVTLVIKVKGHRCHQVVELGSCTLQPERQRVDVDDAKSSSESQELYQLCQSLSATWLITDTTGRRYRTRCRRGWFRSC